MISENYAKAFGQKKLMDTGVFEIETTDADMIARSAESFRLGGHPYYVNHEEKTLMPIEMRETEKGQWLIKFGELYT